MIVAPRGSGMSVLAVQVPKKNKYFDEFGNLTKFAVCDER